MNDWRHDLKTDSLTLQPALLNNVILTLPTGKPVVCAARPVKPSTVGHVEYGSQYRQVYFATADTVVPAQTVGVEQGTHGRFADHKPFQYRIVAQHVLKRFV